MNALIHGVSLHTIRLRGNDMPWMPVNSQEKGGTVAIGTVVAVGTIVMLVVGVPWIRSFLYSIPAALVVALGLRYWHKRHAVDLIQLGYKDYPKRD